MKKETIYYLFWLIIAAIGAITLYFVAPSKKASGAELPDNAVINYYDLSKYQLLKLEEIPTISWVRIIFVVSRLNPEKPHEKIILVTDVRDEYRIIIIYHQKTDGKEIETVGCHTDLDYLDTLGEEKPRWKSFDSNCQEEIKNFLHDFGKICQRKKIKVSKLF